MNQDFLIQWGEAAYTSVGFFWSALWAFALGYVVSSMIQVFVTQERMQRSLGDTNAKSVGLATFFGFISSSCSFAALATTRSLFQKGAGFVPAMAFLLASTNLVIELGIIISVFLGVGSGDSFTFGQILEHTLVGPVAAFFTFIGSMGNIPLAALLYQNGVSFAGVMAFIFSDLVVFPVLRINATYYGWRMSLFILLTLFVALIGTTLVLHYGFELFGALPETGSASDKQQNFFSIDYTFFLNLIFLAVSGFLIWLGFFKEVDGEVPMGGHHMASKGAVDTILKYAALVSYAWLVGGLVVRFFL